MTQTDAITAVLNGLSAALEENGFSAIVPADTEKGALPTVIDGEHTYIDFTGEKGKLRLEFFGMQALLFSTDVSAEEATDEDLKKLSTNYFNPEEFDERDIKSLSNELSESIRSKFGKKSAAKGKSGKMPTPVSRSAVKNGAQSYDGNTLANRLTAMYPDLKAPYHANYEKYGEFLADEFFMEYGTAHVIATIRSKNKSECQKLFRILNDIYENGSNDTQSLIGVTILGEMNNDPELLATAQEYMCEDMSETVVLINKYLATPKGKRAKEQMKNPPAYKPKKEKKPGMFAQALAGANSQSGMPPM
ncbi:MAG: hypothetical protein ACI4K9_02620 [Candidatus Fimenecus sp.]